MRAPASLDPADYPLTGEGISSDLFPWSRVQDDRNVHGPFAIAVPGVVDGMRVAHERFATLPWRELVEPAIELAEAGLLIDWFAVEEHRQRCRRSDSLSRQPRRLSGERPAAGPGLVGAHRSAARRSSAWRRPCAVWPRRGRATSTTASSRRAIAGRRAGGGREAVARGSGELSSPRSRATDDPLPRRARRCHARAHRRPDACAHAALAAAAVLCPARSPRRLPMRPTRCPCRKPTPIASRAWATWRAAGRPAAPRISASSTAAATWRPSRRRCCRSSARASCCRATGILMNNGIMWFDTEPGKPNSLAAGKRCLTNYCPVIGERGARRFALGASGGRRILPAVAQLLSFLIDFDQDLDAAFHLPRIDASEGELVIGDELLPEEIHAALAAQFPYVRMRRQTLPLKFACPSGVSAQRLQQLGCDRDRLTLGGCGARALTACYRFGRSLRPAGARTGEEPDDQPEHRQEQHQHGPHHLGPRAGRALEDVHDRPDVGDQDQASRADRQLRFSRYPPSG